MGVLKKETIPSINISSENTVLTYLHPVSAKSVIVLPRVSLTGIAGGGLYVITAKVDGIQVVPPSSITIATGQTTAVMQSRHVSLEGGDLFTITILGQPTDLTVSSVTVLMDATPIRDTEFDDIINDIEDAIGAGSSTATPVDHNFGGKDKYAYHTAQGAGISDATILAYFTADYNAGKRTNEFVIGTTTTNANGRWRKQIVLESGNYTLLYFKTRAFGPDLAALIVA